MINPGYGKPAFPGWKQLGPEDGAYKDHNGATLTVPVAGMSLREYYIGQAMTCIRISDIDASVRFCVKFADAILRELNK